MTGRGHCGATPAWIWGGKAPQGGTQRWRQPLVPIRGTTGGAWGHHPGHQRTREQRRDPAGSPGSPQPGASGETEARRFCQDTAGTEMSLLSPSRDSRHPSWLSPPGHTRSGPLGDTGAPSECHQLNPGDIRDSTEHGRQGGDEVASGWPRGGLGVAGGGDAFLTLFCIFLGWFGGGFKGSASCPL